MAVTNHERVGRALELLREGLAPFVERELRSTYRDRAGAEAARLLGDDRMNAKKPIAQWDAAALLRVMWEGWNEVFRKTLGQTERTLISELREWRNKWAHQQPLSSDDAYRALDSAGRLLAAVSAPQAAELERMKMELLRVRFDEQVRSEKRRAGGSLIEVAASAGLKPWREVISPHPDVASGRYQQAEFAADLWQVHLGQGSDEYREPVEFFRRTYLTESLKWLLANAVQRLSGVGGEPVVVLQTNFGGGKTHAMIALYHLFSGRPPAELPGVEAVVKDVGVSTLPAVRRVVLDGHRISPGNPSVKPDGTVVRTLWGELAWQLGGREAYERVREDDERATNPGDALRELFDAYGPCLVLIDEWVAYARQLHETHELPGGRFATQFTFAEALGKAARASQRCLVAVSLPASESPVSPHAAAEDVEVGGVRGQEALVGLGSVIIKFGASWRPATADESFEIVRRRLFQPMTDPEQYKARDVVARAFVELYRTQSGEFPAECQEAEYERRIKAAYPIHPEVFDRLYGDWATLVTFQRTRGVLRLMAAVIHSLWERGDRSPLIMPSSIPIDDPRVRFELTRYLSDNWVPVIERDVDGPDSLPARLDAEVPNLGRYSACRRVARTVYLGSAPTVTAAHRGIEDRRIKLGCVLPGESAAVFGDALRKLASQATYVYSDGTRYWYAPQPNVTSLAEDRAAQLQGQTDRIAQEIERRVREEVRRTPGEFRGVHPFPQSSQDVPDEPEARLVVLRVSEPHVREGDSPAVAAARQILEWRGNQPRVYRNALVFLAADRPRLQYLDEAVRRYLAWESILRDKEALNLDVHQTRTAEQLLRDADAAVKARIPEAFQWLLVPVQEGPAGEPDPKADVTWRAIRLQASDSLAVRASRRLVSDALLYPELGAALLRMKLDGIPLWRGDHVEIRQLLEDFARYVYLPRLKDASVLIRAVREGLALLTWEQDGFAYAESFDEKTGRYRGLRVAQDVRLSEAGPVGLLVKPEVARRQLETEVREPQPVGPTPPPGPGPSGPTPGGHGPEAPVQVLRRFYGVKELNPTRAGADAGEVVKEVIVHLANLPGARVRVTLEIQAEVPDGVPDHVIRTVTENCRTLKFNSHEFEGE